MRTSYLLLILTGLLALNHGAKVAGTGFMQLQVTDLTNEKNLVAIADQQGETQPTGTTSTTNVTTTTDANATVTPAPASTPAPAPAPVTKIPDEEEYDIFDDANVDENEIVSDDIDDEEEQDATSLSVFDPVMKSPILTILTGLKNPTHVAVDGFRNFIFIASYDEDTNKGLVNSYHAHVNITNITNPIVTVDQKNTTEVYKGGQITGLSVDDIKGVLFIADSQSKKIILYDYDLISIKKNNKTAPFELTLYTGQPQLKNLQGVACNDNTTLAWGSNAGSEENATGALVIADYRGDVKSINTVTSQIDSFRAITMEDSTVYVIASNSSIYRARLRHGKTYVTLITDKLTDAKDIVVMDKFLYVVDGKQGLVVLKTSALGNGYQEDPKLISTGKITNLRAVTIFRAGAMYIGSAIAGTFMLLVSLMFF